MRTRSFITTFIAFVVGCGGGASGQSTTPHGARVDLSLRVRAGDTFVEHATVDMMPIASDGVTPMPGPLVIRFVSNANVRVASLDDDGSTRFAVQPSGVVATTPLGPVILPPLVTEASELPAFDVRVRPSGRLETGLLDRASALPLCATLALPRSSLSGMAVGETRTEPWAPGACLIGDQSADGTAEWRLVSIDEHPTGAIARLTVRAAATVGGEHPSTGTIEGTIDVSLVDGFRRRSAVTFTTRPVARPAGTETSVFGAVRIGIEVCVGRTTEEIADLGCREGTAPSIATGSQGTPERSRIYTAEECRARTQEMAARLPRLSPALVEVGEVALPELTGAAPLEFPSSVFTYRDGAFELDGSPVSSADLVGRLAQIERTWTLLHTTPFSPSVALVLPRDLALATVAPFLDALDGVPTRLVVEDPRALESLPPPPRGVEWAHARLEEAARQTPEERARTFARVLGDAIGPCEAAIPILANEASAEVTERASTLAREFPRAIASCRCGGVDVDAIDEVLDTLARPTRALGQLPIPPHRRARAALRLRPSATIDDLARRLER